MWRDFILGTENLDQTLNHAEFDILGSNLNTIDYLSNIKPYFIQNIKGVNVGVLGIVNSEISELVPKSKLKNISIDFESTFWSDISTSNDKSRHETHFKMCSRS